MSNNNRRRINQQSAVVMIVFDTILFAGIVIGVLLAGGFFK